MNKVENQNKSLPVCKKCGRCCRGLIVEIEHLDVVREPRLLEYVELLDGHGKKQYESEWDKEYLLACGDSKPCPFLCKNNECGIYPTRPNVCVYAEPGGKQCYYGGGFTE
ncbi:MAG: YkgJ family cysteine cluster protein [Desulfobacteraceae bacterium]|nr:YkgJ family cysteine cluster protein [Desulfobacteraceae bacterium]